MIDPVLNSNPSAEHGATIVEFALASIFLLLFLGITFDIGLGIHQYLLLRHVTQDSTREAAVNFVTNTECARVRKHFETAGKTLLTSLRVRPKDGVSWCIKLLSPDGVAGRYPTLHVSGSLSVDCFFLCSFFPKGIGLTSETETIVETAREDVCEELRDEMCVSTAT